MIEIAGPSIAIVGSGPSGCYTAQFLLKRFPKAQISIFERLAVPYGLIRFGVAPDHAGTKAISQQFDRLFTNPNVKFIGSTLVGRDISLQDLRDNFDAVVLATGLSGDRKIGIEGERLPGVFGSGKITRLINGHPDERIEGVALGNQIVIIGHGNVAIDLVRLSLASAQELKSHGVSEAVVAAIAPTGPRQIEVVGRSGIDQAKFDISMIKELGKVPGVDFSSDAVLPKDADELAESRFRAITELSANASPNLEHKVTFRFGWMPHSINGSKSVTSVTLKNRSGGSELVLNADSVITAIGFEAAESSHLRLNELFSHETSLETGKLQTGLYCVGWLRRGATGTIPTNRVDAKMVSDLVISDFELGNLKTRKA